MCFASQLNQENLMCFPLWECSVVSFLFMSFLFFSSGSHSAFRTNRDAAPLSRRAAFLLSVISLTLFIYVLILSCEVEEDVSFLSLSVQILNLYSQRQVVTLHRILLLHTGFLFTDLIRVSVDFTKVHFLKDLKFKEYIEGKTICFVNVNV